MRRYKSDAIWYKFNDAFNYMPLVGMIGGRILGMHGGLSPHLTTLDQIRNLPRPLVSEQNTMAFDILWSDPSYFQQGWQANNRGASYTFGQDVSSLFCFCY